MTIFCVADGDTSGAEGFNQPLKKVEKRILGKQVPLYSPTGTDGVVLNNRTGKMETQLPLPEDYAQKILPIPFQPLYLYDPEVKRELEEKQLQMRADMDAANFIGSCMNVPRREGKSVLQNKIFSDYLEGMKAKESGQSWLDWAER